MLKPWRKQMWCIPPEQNAEFVCAMENVLEVYHRPYDANRPVVCMDERPSRRVAVRGLPASEARRLMERLEVVYTPKHGSWLNIAEIELGVLDRQCMGERIGNKVELVEKADAWERGRN